VDRTYELDVRVEGEWQSIGVGIFDNYDQAIEEAKSQVMPAFNLTSLDDVRIRAVDREAMSTAKKCPECGAYTVYRGEVFRCLKCPFESTVEEDCKE